MSEITKPATPLAKSTGVTPSERFLADLCDKTFLRLWSYPNPFKRDGKELCDLIAVFENDVFVFFDRESRKFDQADKDQALQWKRWHAEVIEKQITTALGAERYLLSSPDGVFLDSKATIPLPIPIGLTDKRIHKIVVAHGAAEACKAASPANVFGSLAIQYGNGTDFNVPFSISLPTDNVVHVFDTVNLPIIFGELDTIIEFRDYLLEKEAAVRRWDALFYCGEEDLLAHYLTNFDPETKRHFIGVGEDEINCVMIGEGEWADFSKSAPYLRKKQADRVSYAWDELIQRTGQNALDGILLGDGDIFARPSAIREMAKEPRFIRRELATRMLEAVQGFPDLKGFARHLSFWPSFEPGKGYVFLQVKALESFRAEPDYRARRTEMLYIACGAAKLKFPDLKRVVGIGIDAPRFHENIGEDFVLIDTDNWTEADEAHFRERNIFNFFQTAQMREHSKTITEFPAPAEERVERPPGKVGRNAPCPCGEVVPRTRTVS